MELLHHLNPEGVFLRRDALEFGYGDKDLARGLRADQLTRVRHGAYIAKARWQSLDEIGRHRVRCRAVMRTHEGNVALSHVSGAIMHGLRVWGADLSRVHVARFDCPNSRRITDVAHHVGGWSRADVVDVDGLRALSPIHCAIGTAMTNSVEAGLVTLDATYDQCAASDAELLGVASEVAHWRGARRLQVTLRLARPGAESVGESRARYLFRLADLPSPRLQYRVIDARGQVVGITDFAWPEHGLLGEFDGRVKYGRYLRPGEAPGDAVFREKVREDRIRELTGWRMVRFVWDDLASPEVTAARVRRLLS